ncbi:hypothetical protein GW17_00018184 [Ensete ventricosum]|nr:hypothetical protein GW17_00018184 [Ensete ventricosum]
MAHHYHHHHLRYLHSPGDVTVRRTSISTFIKCKTFLGSHVIRHIHHVVRALTNAKSMVWELLSRRNATSSSVYNTKTRRRQAEEVFSSIKPHVTPISEPLNPEEFEIDRCLYYDSTWNSMISAEVMNCDTASCYEDEEDEDEDEGGGGNEIDRLADKFIASCYEKFRLEKQESYRRYQEMLARSM